MPIITILDYDDTLLCSSYLSQKGIVFSTLFTSDVDSISKDISELSEYLIPFLSFLMEQGTVYIVTNAEYGWAETTLEKIMPKIFNLIKGKILIISARTKYQDIYPNDYVKWKKETMRDIINTDTSYNIPLYINDYFTTNCQKINNSSYRCLVSIGDSITERYAILQLHEEKTDIIIKSIKLNENPSLSQLCAEINFLTTFLPKIYKSPCQEDLMTVITKKDNI